MANTLRGFDLGGDRYKFDAGFCSVANGWAQLDTKNDASYCGNWINPITLQLFSYTEGDTALVKCDDEADFIATVRETVGFYKNNGSFLGIDPGVSNPAITEAFERMRLDDLFHGRNDGIWIQYVEHAYPGHWYTWTGPLNSWKTVAYFNTLQEAIDHYAPEAVTILPGRYTR